VLNTLVDKLNVGGDEIKTEGKGAGASTREELRVGVVSATVPGGEDVYVKVEFASKAQTTKSARAPFAWDSTLAFDITAGDSHRLLNFSVWE
jgi:hypothetical protein